MKNFIRQVFGLNAAQILVIFLAGAFKLLFNNFRLPAGMIGVSIIVIIVLFILAAGISGVIENRHGGYENWEERSRAEGKHKLLIWVIWGLYLTAGAGMALVFFSFVTVSPVMMVLGLYGGHVISNLIRYFSSGKHKPEFPEKM